MAFLTESYNDIKQSSDFFDTRMAKVSAYLEAVKNEYNINLEECELKVMKESGTIDDLEYLTEEATSGFVGKVVEAIKAIIKAFKEFCSDIKDKIINMVSKKEVSESINSMEKKIKLNPFLSKKKIKYIDAEKEIKFCDEFQSKIKRLFAKLKHGRGDEKDVKALENEYESARKKIIAASVITVTIGAAIVLLKKYKNEMGPMSVKAEEEGSKILNDAMSGFDDETKETSAAAYSAAARLSAKISKHKQNAIVDTFGNVWSAVKDGLMRLKGNTPNDIMENGDVAYLESLREELFNNGETPAEEDGTDNNFNPDEYTKEYMNSMEQEIFGNMSELSEPDVNEEPLTESGDDDKSYSSIIEDFLKDF